MPVYLVKDTAIDPGRPASGGAAAWAPGWEMEPRGDEMDKTGGHLFHLQLYIQVRVERLRKSLFAKLFLLF